MGITMNMNYNNDQQQQHYLSLQQIECNKISVLAITKEVEDVFLGGGDNVYHDDIHLLLRALVRNESITTITFEGDFLDCLREDRRSELISAVGSYLPSLIEITLGDTPMSVTDLCHLVRKSESIITLQLHDLILQGSIDDLNSLEVALLCSTSIKEFELKECTSTIYGGIDLLNKIQDSWNRKKSSFITRAITNNNTHNRALPLPQNSSNNYYTAKKQLSYVPRTA